MNLHFLSWRGPGNHAPENVHDQLVLFVIKMHVHIVHPYILNIKDARTVCPRSIIDLVHDPTVRFKVGKTLIFLNRKCKTGTSGLDREGIGLKNTLKIRVKKSGPAQLYGPVWVSLYENKLILREVKVAKARKAIPSSNWLDLNFRSRSVLIIFDNFQTST